MSDYKIYEYLQREYKNIINNSGLEQIYELGCAAGIYRTLRMLQETKLLSEESVNSIMQLFCEGGEKINKYIADICKNEKAEYSEKDNIEETLSRNKEAYIKKIFGGET